MSLNKGLELAASSQQLTASGFAAYYPYFYAPKRATEYDH